MLTIKEASEELGVNTECFTVSQKYQPFIHRTPGKRDGRFDMKAYLRVEDNNYELTQKAQLFVQYLVHEEGMAYTAIARLIGVNQQSMQQLDFGIGIAMKLSAYFVAYRPFHVKRFNTYYGFREREFRRRSIWKNERRMKKIKVNYVE